MGKLIVVTGGQFGSEGKGRVAGDLAEREKNLMAVRVGGPNAGHCIVRFGKEWKLRQLPTAVLTNPAAPIMIGPGSEVDEELLYREVQELEEVLGKDSVKKRLRIDSTVTLLEQAHKDTESGDLTDRVGGTGSGTGAARSERLMRRASLWPHPGADVPRLAMDWLDWGGTVIVEGCQGYGLGLHAGFYPYCSSADFRAIDILAMAGLSPWYPGVEEFEVWVVLRVFPIRVGGNSGPMVGESSWEDLGLEEERTTVTNRVRRVGEWDSKLARQAIRENGGSRVNVALTMVDHAVPGLAGTTKWNDRIEGFVRQLELDMEGAKVCLVGTGKTTLAWRS